MVVASEGFQWCAQGCVGVEGAAEKGAKGKREDASRRESWVRDGRKSAVHRVASDGSRGGI